MDKVILRFSLSHLFVFQFLLLLLSAWSFNFSLLFRLLCSSTLHCFISFEFVCVCAVYKINKHRAAAARHRTQERNSIEEMNWLAKRVKTTIPTSEVEMKTNSSPAEESDWKTTRRGRKKKQIPNVQVYSLLTLLPSNWRWWRATN